MQIWQLFIVPRHPVTISVTVFLNMTKLTKDLHIDVRMPLLLTAPPHAS